MNLVCPASIISQGFDCGRQIYKISHEEHFARVQRLQCLEIKNTVISIQAPLLHGNKPVGLLLQTKIL